VGILIGCGQGTKSSEALLGGKREQAVTDVAGSPGHTGENAGPTAIVITWKGSQEEQTGAALTANLYNTTPSALSASLTLVGIAPTGDPTTRPLGSSQIPAGGTVSVNIPASTLPVQSEGLASTLTLVATYPSAAQLAPNQAPILRDVQSFSPMLHVTSDSASGLVTARDAASQARVNGAATGNPFARLTRLTVYDAASGKVVDASATVKGAARDQAKPLVQVMDRRPGVTAPPGGRTPMLQEDP
jgi:hypothetical protein